MADGKIDTNLIEFTTDIVAAYVGNNPVAATDLPNLINDVYSALERTSVTEEEPAAPPQKPAISVKKSLTDDYIICLEDGKKFKSLKRHLRTHYDMTPEEYREKWGLPANYPMVAPSYAAARSRLAKEIGLGQKRKRKN